MQQRTLLQLEYYTEKEAFRKLTEQMGMQRKVKRGDAWFPLQVGKSFYNSLNQTAIEVFRTSDQDIEHNFEFGRPVMFFRSEGSEELKYFSFTGTVSYVDGDRMVVTVPDSAPLLELQQSTDPIGVQLSFDETSYKLMFEALDRVMKAKNNRLAYLRDLFYSHQKAGRFSFEPMKFPWLNPTQERAVNEVLWAKDVAIVHGPPGTGKTRTRHIRRTIWRGACHRLFPRRLSPSSDVRHEVRYPLYRRGCAGFGRCLLDSDEESHQGDSGGRPLSAAAYSK